MFSAPSLVANLHSIAPHVLSSSHLFFPRLFSSFLLFLTSLLLCTELHALCAVASATPESEGDSLALCSRNGHLLIGARDRDNKQPIGVTSGLVAASRASASLTANILAKIRSRLAPSGARPRDARAYECACKCRTRHARPRLQCLLVVDRPSSSRRISDQTSLALAKPDSRATFALHMLYVERVKCLRELHPFALSCARSSVFVSSLEHLEGFVCSLILSVLSLSPSLPFPLTVQSVEPVRSTSVRRRSGISASFAIVSHSLTHSLSLSLSPRSSFSAHSL